MVRLACLDCTYSWELEIPEDTQDEFLSVLGIGDRVPTRCAKCGSNRIKADIDS